MKRDIESGTLGSLLFAINSPTKHEVDCMTVTDRPELPPTAEPTLPMERAPRMILEICRGRTRFPQRPISGPRYFIGSGPSCDLRLGGPDFPALHSLIQTRENGVWFETLADTPAVRINGEVTHGEWLRDGDRIEIGAFQFLAHLLPMLPPIAINTAGLPRRVPQVSEMSASELADRLEDEMIEVEHFETARQAGGQALLQALRRRELLEPQAAPAIYVAPQARPQPVEAVSTAAQHEFQSDLDRLCRDLADLTSTLERRSETISKREIQFAQAAESLLETQRRLVEQLESALEHAAELAAAREVPRKPTIRVSA